MVGRAFAAVALKHGHDVMLSNSRTPDTLFTLRAVLNCKIGSPQEAAAVGDSVLVAIPLKNYASVPVAPLEGKIVIDAKQLLPRARWTYPRIRSRGDDYERITGSSSSEIEDRQGA
jgi:8-hydroxy-5-deazaflavin:NADPH oxidoreductase